VTACRLWMRTPHGLQFEFLVKLGRHVIQRHGHETSYTMLHLVPLLFPKFVSSVLLQLKNLLADPVVSDCPNSNPMITKLMRAVHASDVHVLKPDKTSALLLNKCRVSGTPAQLLPSSSTRPPYSSPWRQRWWKKPSPCIVHTRQCFYYWLITAMVVSPAVGAFPTEYTAWCDP